MINVKTYIKDKEKEDPKYDTFITSHIKHMFNSNIKKDYENKVGLPNGKKIQLITTYHYNNIIDSIKKTDKDSFILVLDGEPMDLRNLNNYNIDLIISTKKELLPKNIPVIYLPYYIQCFFQFLLNYKPTDLLYKKKIKKTKFCSFLYSNCNNMFKGVRDRKKFLELLQKKSKDRVDNLGKCYNKKYIETDMNNNDILLQPYKFNISFENERIKGYVSEKILMPMLAGTIPIYLGAPDIEDHFNPKSFINVANFNSFEECIDYILYLDSNDEAYNKILNEPWLKDNKLSHYFDILKGGNFYNKIYELFPDIIKIERLFNKNIRFITFADTKIHRFERICKEALDSGYFKEIKAYSPSDLNIDFWNKHKEFILNNKRGYGYWIWKPQVILQSMEELQDGDFLIWSDSGNKIKVNNKIMLIFYKILENNISGIIPFQMKHIEKEWSKKDAIVKIFSIEFNNPKIIDTGQFSANIILFKKCQNSYNFVKEWKELCENYNLINDSPSILSNSLSFKENRHDQTIYSLLLKKYNIEPFDISTIEPVILHHSKI